MPAPPDFDVIFPSRLGAVGLCFTGNSLVRIAYLEDRKIRPAQSDVAVAAQKQIERFVSARIESINIPYLLEATAFQKKVLAELLCIPYGEVQTYGEIAARLQTSARAVGNACRRNPLPLVIPCHRVVSASGIGGYDGAQSGRLLEIKRRLLENEGVLF